MVSQSLGGQAERLNVVLRVQKLYADAVLPALAYEASAAYDLTAYLKSSSGHPITMVLAPTSTRLIGTGLAMCPPSGCLILICSRSGLASRGIFVANAPGVVDPDYTGEIKVALFNGGPDAHYLKHGDRIAQALIVPFRKLDIETVAALPPTERGARGFGSTGD